MVLRISTLRFAAAALCFWCFAFITTAEAAPAKCAHSTNTQSNYSYWSCLLSRASLSKSVLNRYASQSPKPTVAAQTTSSTAQNRELLRLVNNHRRSIGKPPFVWNSTIEQTIKGHVQNMNSGKVPGGHSGSKERYAKIYQAVKGTKGCSEVVGWVKSGMTPQKALNGWLNSPGHRKILESDRQIAGFAIIGQYGGGIACTK